MVRAGMTRNQNYDYISGIVIGVFLAIVFVCASVLLAVALVDNAIAWAHHVVYRILRLPWQVFGVTRCLNGSRARGEGPIIMAKILLSNALLYVMARSLELIFAPAIIMSDLVDTVVAWGDLVRVVTREAMHLSAKVAPLRARGMCVLQATVYILQSEDLDGPHK